MQKRKIWQKIKKYIGSNKTIVITGPRRVGKTVTLKWILTQVESNNQLYFDFENVNNRDIFLIRDYDSILNEFQNLGLNLKKKMYIAIDEIQYVKNIPSVIKYLSDNYNIQFFVSGSSSYYLKNHFTESLTGRKIVFDLYPLVFSEFLDFNNVTFKSNFKFKNPKYFSKVEYERLKTYYEEYIKFGGLPGIISENSIDQKIAYLEDAYSSYVNIDVQSLSDFKSLEAFRKIVRLLASRVGSKLNTSELSKVTGVNRATVESYIEFMEQTYLIRRIPVYSSSSDVALRKQEKIYFIDNGILSVNSTVSSGAAFENAIAAQLAYKKKLEYFERSSREIDFIVNGKFGIEVKETPTKPDLNILLKRTGELDLKSSFIVGRHENASFDDFVWGGSLG